MIGHSGATGYDSDPTRPGVDVTANSWATGTNPSVDSEETPRPAGFVPSTELWWIDGETFLGRVGIRHRLTPNLLETGGHIGYDVRPSARRRGHATAMLRQALIVARGLGIERALITCDVDNVGSRAVIERTGGVLEDERSGTLRFWVSTG